jgi:hypothetical protein
VAAAIRSVNVPEPLSVNVSVVAIALQATIREPAWGVEAMDALVVASDQADARAAETTEPNHGPQVRLRIKVVTLIPHATRHATVFGGLDGVAARCGPGLLARRDPPVPAHVPGVLLHECSDWRFRS